MSIKVKNRDPKKTDFASDEIVINRKEGTLFFKSDKNLIKLSGDDLSTETVEGSSTSVWTLSGDNIFYSDGKVGIGTSTPAYTLDLGENSSTIRLVSEDDGTAIRIGAGGASNDVTLLRVDGETNSHDGESDNSKFGFSLKYMGSRVGNENSLSIFSDAETGTAVEALTVLQDGKVGIGTTTPGATLHVNGIVSTSNDIIIESGDPTIHFKDTDGAFQGHVGVANALMELRTDQNDVDIEIRTNQFDSAIFIDDSTQRIGIGTETPDSTLTVNGDISASGVVFAARFESSGSDTKIDMVDDVVVTGNHTTSGSLSALRITSSLDGVQVSGSVDIILQDGPTEFIKTKVGSFDEYHFRNDGNAFQIYNSTDDRKELVVDGDGGIGIGVSTPSVNGFALQVSGTIGVLGDGDHALGTKANRFSDVFAVQTTVGAIFETGLTTEGIGKLETGTVVVWKDGKLVPSYKEQDKMVMGVTQEGKDEPIILGAEPILVTGEVKEGDFLITSDKLGHAKAQSDEYLLRTGTVIAQALESTEGESNLIKGMIRKL